MLTKYSPAGRNFAKSFSAEFPGHTYLRVVATFYLLCFHAHRLMVLWGVNLHSYK